MALPDWDLEKALAAMDQLDVATAMLSISSPGVYFGDAGKARRLAREVNEDGAALVRRRPDRFGLFATIPLPDVQGSLDEIAHAFDTLGCDGIALKTNHAGRYLGDRAFDPVFDELNARRAIVFIHPTSPSCDCCGDGIAMGYPRPMIEFFFETTRAAINLILSGTVSRCPNIRFIIPHAGATLPILAERVAELAPLLGLGDLVTPGNVYAQLRSFHYDLAGFPIPRQLDVLLDIADVGKLLYGSDWPFTPLPIARKAAERLDATPLFDPQTRAAMYRGNALALFPRLRQAAAR